MEVKQKVLAVILKSKKTRLFTLVRLEGSNIVIDSSKIPRP